MTGPTPSPREEPTGTAAADRRAFVRYDCRLDAACRPTADRREPGWFAKVHDISAGGIGLLFRYPFRSGTPLLVELKRDDGAVIAVLSARVVHATAVFDQGDLGWLVGCAFPRPLSDAELQPLLG